ncbi:MAG: YidC/Oxa1 family membrane protein insertase [Patescibacteria group bacterium]
MFSYIWHTFFFDPVYNLLVFFIDVVPGGDVGLAIIFATLVVKFILLPLSIKAAKTQKLMKELEPKLKEIKEQYKDQREEQAKAMMEVYREAGMNPFASIALIFLQIPIIIALYLSVFSGGGVALPDINIDILYSFIPAPMVVDMNFLGLIDIAGKSFILAALAGATQFVHAQLAMPPVAPKEAGAAPNFKEDFTRSLQLQMKYVMPILIFVVAYTISAAIALYFFVSNVAAIAQELYIRRHR